MLILVSRGFWVSAFCALSLVLVGCGGGSSSSSGSGGGATFNSSMMVKGNVTSVSGGAARVDFESGQAPLLLAKSFARYLIPSAEAQTAVGGIEVCVESVCTVTADDGSFSLNVESLPGGNYIIRFIYESVTYEAPISIKNYSITELQGVVLMDASGQISIANIRVTNLQPPVSDEDDTDEGVEEEEQPTPKIAVCHKPGTPAEKTLVVSESALKGHLGHGDDEGPCAVNAEPVVAE